MENTKLFNLSNSFNLNFLKRILAWMSVHLINLFKIFKAKTMRAIRFKKWDLEKYQISDRFDFGDPLLRGYARPVIKTYLHSGPIFYVIKNVILLHL